MGHLLVRGGKGERPNYSRALVIKACHYDDAIVTLAQLAG